MNSKVLNIGLPRTGTFSLAVALGILGYKTKHYPERIFDIKNYQAACEVVFPYKELEELYPNSLYVFTTRKFDQWIASCHRHIVYKKQNWNKFWKDPNFWKTIYFEKNESIKEIDKKRLLILDIEEKDRWSKICDFLQKPTPDLPYPHLNKSCKFL